MPSPYRESDNIPPAPLAELDWRTRVAANARLAVRLLLAEALLLLVTAFPHLALAGAVAWFALGAALVVATWRATGPRPDGRVGWRGWLLRVSVAVYLAATGRFLMGMQIGTPED